jgi:hypothetical protein
VRCRSHRTDDAAVWDRQRELAYIREGAAIDASHSAEACVVLVADNSLRA